MPAYIVLKFESLEYVRWWYEQYQKIYSDMILVEFKTKRRVKAYVIIDPSKIVSQKG